MTAHPSVVVITGLPGTGKSTLAEHAGRLLGAPVLAWDWVMAGLTPFPSVRAALKLMTGPAHVRVGWSIMWNIAELQLRQGRSVVFDAVARQEQINQTRELADRNGARILVVLSDCADPEVHRERVEGRRRDIPGWHELDWPHVESVRSRFDPPEADLTLDSVEPLQSCLARLEELLDGC